MTTNLFVSQFTRLSNSTDQENEIEINDFQNKTIDSADESEIIEDEDDVLPPSVLLVASFPTQCDSPSPPFKLRNQTRKFSDESTECK